MACNVLPCGRLRSLLLLLPWLAIAAGDVAGRPAPNIVFILADDLGYGDLGCYGQQKIATPHLDRLASEGLRFTQAYSGSTVCAPSRCSLITGLHTGHSRIRGNGGGQLAATDPSLGKVLAAAGYQCVVFGKWGLGEPGGSGSPLRQGFTSFLGYFGHGHAHNYWPEFIWRDEVKLPLRNRVPKGRADGAGVAAERLDYVPDLVTDEAARFIGKADAKPFFLLLTYTLPHANNEAGKLGMEVPDEGAYRDKPWPPAQRSQAAMVARLDSYVGRIVTALRDRGGDRDTLILFTSDNGPHREGGGDPDFFASSGGLRGIKRDLYEGGVRVPLIAWRPGRIAAGTSSQVVAFWDMLPTLAAVTGAKAPDGDGESFADVLDGQRPMPRERELYWEFHEKGFRQAARIGDWKGVRHGAAAMLEVYDLAKDQAETTDVAAQQPEVVKRLTQYLDGARTVSKDWPIPAKR